MSHDAAAIFFSCAHVPWLDEKMIAKCKLDGQELRFIQVYLTFFSESSQKTDSYNQSFAKMLFYFFTNLIFQSDKIKIIYVN